MSSLGYFFMVSCCGLPLEKVVIVLGLQYINFVGTEFFWDYNMWRCLISLRMTNECRNDDVMVYYRGINYAKIVRLSHAFNLRLTFGLEKVLEILKILLFLRSNRSTYLIKVYVTCFGNRLVIYSALYFYIKQISNGNICWS